MVSCISSDGGHCLWLQRPFNLLTRERRAYYVAAIFLRIFGGEVGLMADETIFVHQVGGAIGPIVNQR